MQSAVTNVHARRHVALIAKDSAYFRFRNNVAHLLSKFTPASNLLVRVLSNQFRNYIMIRKLSGLKTRYLFLCPTYSVSYSRNSEEFDQILLPNVQSEQFALFLMDL